MTTEDKHHIMIVEDDQGLGEMLNAYFIMQGYRATTIAWGTDAVERATALLPDVILLDIHLPDIDGFEVCKRLRESHKTRHIPILFLTESNDRLDKIQGLEMGGVDYITKPFDIQELRLRARNAIHRAEAIGEENPITYLPEGSAVDSVLEQYLTNSDDRAVLVAALCGLNTFRELYGFIASDDVLRVTSRTIANAAREICNEHQPFCGHLDDHTLIMLVPDYCINRLQTRIMERIGEALEYFYPANNRGTNAHTPDRLRIALIASTPHQDEPFADLAHLKQWGLSRPLQSLDKPETAAATA